MQYYLRIFLLGVLTCVFVSPASADLIIDITGIAGSGQTTWTFRGSAIATADGQFDEDTLQVGDSWYNLGDIFASTSGYANLEISTPSGASITTSDGTRGIDSLFFHSVATPGGDDFGVGVVDVSGNANLDFLNTETVSWTGSFVLPEDLTNFEIGTYNGNNLGAASAGNLNLTVNVTAVPEPASLLGLSLSLFLCSSFRRSKNSR